MAAGVFEHGAFERGTAWAGLGKTAGDDNGGTRASAAAGFDDGRHGFGAGADDGEVEPMRN